MDDQGSRGELKLEDIVSSVGPRVLYLCSLWCKILPLVLPIVRSDNCIRVFMQLLSCEWRLNEIKLS